MLLPVAGIVDILDNYAFVRTTGYLAGPTDVYVSLSMVRRYGLRRGDAVTGAVRQPREGEQSRQKFNPLVRVDTLNGQDPEIARNRPEFTKLTPLYPNERLRLETEPHKLTTRVIDLVMPVGKGQRALIVSPPKAGKTTIMQNIANAITTNNPECHLMVVLVDERPEEVTDMQRSVKGEVIASTFDRPPTDHTTVAELSIERAKRLVEMGHDVVVLLDNITRLGRAYNLAAPASGRILSGGVDSTALYPPKRFLGAARNIEGGGSLTIFATALVETGSTMDTVIFEEFKGTGNAELRLDRKIADKRIFPAIDVGDSGTRKEELLMSPDEYAVMVKLRRVLGGLDDQQAINLLLEQLRKTRTNIEFLMQVAKSTPGTTTEHRFAAAVTAACRGRSSCWLRCSWPAVRRRRPALRAIRRPSTPDAPAALLVAAGDVACGPDIEETPSQCRQEATADLVEGLNPDAVLVLGDTAYEEVTPDSLKVYDASWGRFLDRTHAVVGNHEYYGNGPDAYWDYFGDRAGHRGEGWYSFDVGAWHVVVLNSECADVDCGPDGEQLHWLADDLNSSSARCTLAAFHRPRFSSGEEYGDDESVSGLWQALQDEGVDVVLNGHEHSYERFAPQRDSGRATAEEGMAEFVVGTGGRDLRGFGDRETEQRGALEQLVRRAGADPAARPLRLAVPRDGRRGRRSRQRGLPLTPGTARAGADG